MHEYRLAKLTWPEVKVLAPGADCIILPVGSTEQHARHMPVDTDHFASNELAKRTAELAAEEGLKIYIAPSINYGVSWYHTGFPGTVSISTRVFMDMIKQVSYGIHKSGFKNIILLNSHGGNNSAIDVAMTELYEEEKIRVYGAFYFNMCKNALGKFGVKSPFTHSEQGETSMNIALGQRVLMEEARRECFNRKEALRAINVPTSKHINYNPLECGSVTAPMDFIDDISESGIVGDATLSGIDLGLAMVDEILATMVELIKDLNK